jgi:hypothetical protein
MGKWLFNGVDLSSMARNVSNRAAGWQIPARRGGNRQLPNQHGSVFVPNKPFDEGSVPLRMWAVGCDEDGNIPDDVGSAELCRRNVESLLSLFTTGSARLQELRRVEGAGYGQTNLMPNPGFFTGLTSELLYSNVVPNPALATAGSVEAIRNTVTNPNSVGSTAFASFAENVYPDPLHKLNRSATQSFLDANYITPQSFESQTVGASFGSNLVLTNVTGIIRAVSGGDGANVLEVEATSALAANAVFWRRNRFGIPAGTTSYLRFRVRRESTSTTTRSIQVRWTWCDTTSTPITQTAWTSHTLPTGGGWSTFHMPYTVVGTEPAGANSAYVEIRTGEAWALGEGIYLDGLTAGANPNLDSTGPDPASLSGDDLWADAAGTADGSISTWNRQVIDPRWTVDPQTASFHAFAVTPSTDAAGSTMGFIASADVASGTQSFTAACLPVTAGQPYTLRCVARALTGTTATVQLLLSTDGGATKTPQGTDVTVVGSGSASATGGQQTGATATVFGATVVPVSGSDLLYVRVIVPVSRSGNQLFQFSSLSVSTAPQVVNGDTVDDAANDYSWAGTPYASKSLLKKKTVPGWVSGASWIGSGLQLLNRDSVEVMCRRTAAVTEAVFTGVTISQRMRDNGMLLSAVAVSANTTTAATARLRLRYVDSGGNVVGTVTGGSVLLNKLAVGTETYQSMSVTVTPGSIPVGSVTVRVVVDMVSPVLGQIIWASRFQLLDRAYSMPFFSGASGAGYSWQSAANASQSVFSNPQPGLWALAGAMPTNAAIDTVGLSATGETLSAITYTAPVTVVGGQQLLVGCRVASTAECVWSVELLNGTTVVGSATMGTTLGGTLTNLTTLQSVVTSTGDVTGVRFRVVLASGAVFGSTSRVRLYRAHLYPWAESRLPRINQNLLPNATFGAGTALWSLTRGGTPITQTGLTAISNAFGTGVSTTSATLYHWRRVAVTAGRTLWVSATGRFATTATLNVVWQNAADGIVSTDPLQTGAATNGLQRLAGFATAPAGAAWASLYVSVPGRGVTELYRAYLGDAVGADYSPGTDPTTDLYVDGDTAVDLQGLNPSWSGTPNASPTDVTIYQPNRWTGLLRIAEPNVRPTGSTGPVAAFPPSVVTQTAQSDYVAAVAGYTSGEIALAFPRAGSVTVKVVQGVDAADPAPAVLWSTTVSSDGIVRWRDVPCSGPWLAVWVDHLSVAGVFPGPGTFPGVDVFSDPPGAPTAAVGPWGLFLDNTLLLNGADPVAVDYPGYFDGWFSGAQWLSDESDSPSITFAGARRVLCEVQAAIGPDSMAGGTRAELEVDLAVPGVFWEDVATVVHTVEVTGTSSLVPLDAFAGSTAPIEDSVIEVTLVAGASTATWLTVTDVDSGAWIRVATPAFAISTRIQLDCAAFRLTRNSSSISKQLTKGGPARFFTLNPYAGGSPVLKVDLESLAGTIRVSVTGRRKYQIA